MREDIKEKCGKLKAFLEDHRCSDVVIVDMEKECSWTDAFIIATVTSVGHLRGVVHQIWNELIDLGMDVNNRHKSPGSDGWASITSRSSGRLPRPSDQTTFFVFQPPLRKR